MAGLPGYEQYQDLLSNFGQGLTPINKSVAPDHSAEDYQYEQNLALQKQAQEFNAAQAQLERDWQERMSSSAYQRAAADLEAAGLNRWLAVGSPASSGQGAYASSGQNYVGMGDTPAEKMKAKASMIFAISNMVTSAVKAVGSFL